MKSALSAASAPRRTQTALLDDDLAICDTVEALKRLGFSLALDDSGTGHSSLSVLQRFSIDRIKSGSSFMSALSDSGESDALVESMMRLVRAMNLKLIAVGVETESQLALLTARAMRLG